MAFAVSKRRNTPTKQKVGLVVHQDQKQKFVSNHTPSMKRTHLGGNTYQVENKPVGMKYKRRCGTIVAWAQKDEKCGCIKCR